MVNRSSSNVGARKRSRPQAAAPSNAARSADHALANILGWTQLLVDRGNRLIEIAVRERADAGRKSDARGRKPERLHAKPLA